MLKIKLFLPILLILSVVMSGTAFANTEDPQIETDSPPYHIFLPLISNEIPEPPTMYSTSRYMTASSMSNSYIYGCEIGTRDKNTPGYQDSLVILAYGKPKYVNGKYGSYAFGSFVDTSQIALSVKEYARGYWECSGSDTGSKIDIAIGTSNFNYDYYATGICQDFFCTYNEGFAHGKAWALLVKDVYQWILQKGYQGQISISGANDIELAWNTPEVTHGWADGFDANDDDFYIFYNFGACEGCPTRLSPTWKPAAPWSMNDVYYTAWYVTPVWPIPEIYAKSGIHARQWAYLSYWATNNNLWKIEYVGLLTQYQACYHSAGNLAYCLGDLNTELDDLDNTPEEGWQQLYDEINFWPQTAQSIIRWMSDIRWP
jgi:hypothetical protein